MIRGTTSSRGHETRQALSFSASSPHFLLPTTKKCRSATRRRALNLTRAVDAATSSRTGRCSRATLCQRLGSQVNALVSARMLALTREPARCCTLAAKTHDDNNLGVHAWASRRSAPLYCQRDHANSSSAWAAAYPLSIAPCTVERLLTDMLEPAQKSLPSIGAASSSTTLARRPRQSST